MKIKRKDLRKIILETAKEIELSEYSGNAVNVGETEATFKTGSGVYKGPGEMKITYKQKGNTLEVDGVYIDGEFQEPSLFGDVSNLTSGLHSRRLKKALQVIKNNRRDVSGTKITKVDLVGKYQ